MPARPDPPQGKGLLGANAQTLEGDGVMRMLLEQSGDEHGGVETGLHRLQFAQFTTTLVSLLLDKQARVP